LITDPYSSRIADACAVFQLLGYLHQGVRPSLALGLVGA
jgi:hypothetical protein